MLEEAWGDSNRPKPNLEMMTKSVHKLVWRDPHQLYQRLESQLRDFVMELRMRLVDLLQKQAKNPNLAQVHRIEDFLKTFSLNSNFNQCAGVYPKPAWRP